MIRRRLYSWSRPSKSLPRQCKYDSEMRISGAATLAFSPDLRWFQGNIIGEAEEAYTITGRLRSSGEEEQGEAGLSPALDICPELSSSAGSGGDQLSPPSEAGSLDSELVRVAMESLGLEEEELLYTVSIMDFETGTNHALEVHSSILIIIIICVCFRMFAAALCRMFVI